MSSTRKLFTLAGLALGGTIGALTPAAIAQDSETHGEVVIEMIDEDGKRHVVTTDVIGDVDFAAKANPHEHDEDHQFMSSKNGHFVIKKSHGDGQVFELKMTDGDVIILRNGERVHKKHIQTAPGRYIVLGDDGGELTTFELEGMGGAPHAPNAPRVQKMWVGEGAPEGNVFFHGGAKNLRGFTTGANVESFGSAHPPVMLGIHLGEPGPALRYHLGLGEIDAILVEGVTDGLAADRSGLRKYDVIVSVDGSGEANGEVLHKVLTKKDPGDELRMIVMRGCDKIRIEADLDAYSAQKLGAANVQFGVAPDAREDIFKFRTAPKVAQGRPFVWSNDRDELLHSLHNKLKGHMSDEQLEHAHKAIQEALGGMNFDFEFGPDSGGAGVMEFRWDGKDHKLVIPKGKDIESNFTMELMPQIERRIERHTEHAEKKAEELHERLSERLERLSEEIERLRESLDDLD